MHRFNRNHLNGALADPGRVLQYLAGFPKGTQAVGRCAHHQSVILVDLALVARLDGTLGHSNGCGLPMSDEIAS
jgi:hypothetical protein